VEVKLMSDVVRRRPIAALPAAGRVGVSLVLTFVGVFALTTIGSAQPVQPPQDSRDLRDLSLEELGAVKVTTVSKQPMDLWGAAAAITVITRDDIRRSGATTLPELLRQAPGVEVARIDASHWSIGIRGFGEPFSRSILVLLDGRNIYTPLFAGTYWPAYDTPLEDIERIEIVRGPGGSIWGGNSVNGVINIVTRRASDTLGTLASIGTGSIDHGTATVRYGGSNGTNLHYRVHAKGFIRGPQHHVEADNEFDSDWWMSQGGFRMEWDTAQRGTFTVQGDVSRGQHGLRVLVGSYAPVGNIVRDGLAETSGGHVLASWEHVVAGTDFRLQSYYDRLVWESPSFTETRDIVDIDLVQRAPEIARHRFAWGAGFRWSPGRFHPLTDTLDFTPRTHTDRLFSGFVQDEIRVIPDRLNVTVGAKLEHNVYTGLEWMPSARVAWTPHPRHTAWAAATRAVRTPSRIERAIELTELGASNGPIFVRALGSDTFEAERAVSYETGYRVMAGTQLSFDVAAYYTEHDDLLGLGAGAITFEPAPIPHLLLTVPVINGILGESYGFEIAPEWRPLPWWRLTGGYGFRRVDLRSNPLNIDVVAVTRYEGSSPRHLGRVQSRLTLPRGWELDATWRQVGALPARRIEGYQTADLRLGWRWARGLEFSVSGENLLEPHHFEYREEETLPPVGISRSVFARLTWTRTARR
jgi:iron complex outermembrane receptor protein